MKKLIKILLAGILTVVTAIMLIACAPADLAKAEEKMEEKGYNVSVSKNELGLINNCDGWISINDSEGILDIDFKELATTEVTEHACTKFHLKLFCLLVYSQ